MCAGNIYFLYWRIIEHLLATMGCSQSQKETDNHGLLLKPHVFFLLGGPGSGKGTQSDNLVRDYKLKHLSSGDLLREEKERGGELAATIDSYIREGKLLPSELVVKLLKKGISTYGNRRYLLDGFPRNRENWEEFEKQLADLVVVRNLIYFDCPAEVMTARIMGRSLTSGRSDDNPETIRKRLETFQRETLPVVRSFEEKGNCIRIDATQSKEEVYDQIREKLTLANVYPPAPAKIIFILGGPGSGKGTQCAILVKKYGFIHLSTGDLLREEVKSGSVLGQQIDAVIKEGRLISSQLMVQMLQAKIEHNNYGGRYLLDGFPRGQENMDVWQQLMARWVSVQSVLFFECDHTELKRRLLSRGATSGRNDDNEEIIGKRLQIFDEQTRPVVDYYQQQGQLTRFDATQSIEAVTQQVEAHLESIGIFPKTAKADRPRAVIVLGNSGSGKTSQSQNICEKYGFVNISVGDLLREEIRKAGRHAELFSEVMKQGKLVPSDLVVQLMKGVVEKHGWKGVFVLDGFPRNKDNLTKWNEELGVEIDLQLMLVLNCEQHTAEQRISRRLAGRVDDNPVSVQKKAQTYLLETLPIIKEYSQQQDFVFPIDANPSEPQVFAQIKSVLEAKGFKMQADL